MSVSARVDTLTLQWRPATPDLVDEARFARVGQALAADALDAAFDGVDSDPDELICIRRLVLDPVRAGADDADQELIHLIRQAVAGSLHRTLAAGGDEVVRYRSRAEARADALVSLGAGDRSRRWAWRQLDLWPLDDGPVDPGAAMALVLDRDRDVLAPVLADLEPAALDAVVQVLGPDRLGALARRRWPDVWDELSDWPHQLSDREPTDADLGLAVPALGRSPLGRRLLAGPAWPGPTLATLALLAVLAAEPSLADGDPAAVPTWPGAAVALVLARAARGLSSGGDEGPGQVADPTAASPQPPTTGLDAGEALLAGAHPLEPAATTCAERTWLPPDGGSVGGGVANPPVLGAIDDQAEALADQVRGTRRFATDWAGLLFLLPLVERSGLVGRVLGGPSAEVGVRRVLYAVGRALARRLVDAPDGLDPSDPALLVFCGLAPGHEPPCRVMSDRDGSPPDALGLGAQAEEEAARLVVELRRSLVPDPLADAETSELLRAVCARRALVVPDPGWIDVHLALDDVSTAVRRAGLDLDPGYRSWLGVVVRFRYA